MVRSFMDDFYPEYDDATVREQRTIAQKFDITAKTAQKLLESNDPETLFWLLLRHNDLIQMPSDKLDIIYNNKEKLAINLLNIDGYTPSNAVLHLVPAQPNVSSDLVVKLLYEKKTTLDVLQYCTIPEEILDTYITKTFIKNSILKIFNKINKDTYIAILSQKNITTKAAEMFFAFYIDVLALLYDDLQKFNDKSITAVISAMRKARPKNHFLTNQAVYDFKEIRYAQDLNTCISTISHLPNISDDNIKQLYKLFIDSNIKLKETERDFLVNKLLNTKEAKDIMQSLNIQFVSLQRNKLSKAIVNKIVNRMFYQDMQIS